MSSFTSRSLVAITLLSFITACASHPDKLTAASTSSLKYNDFNCKQIALDSDRVGTRMITLYEQLSKTADRDTMQMTVGLLLLWPTLFFLEGGDGAEATEYRELKGEYEVLQKASVQKQCNITFRNIEEEIKAREEEKQKETQPYPGSKKTFNKKST